MAANIDGIFEEKLQKSIVGSNVLIVGAGGIGCEILKNLVLSGFIKLHIIDLDTIDVSNLNRQFLFHKEHVGKSKAEVAKSSALSFNANVEITADCDSITNSIYGVTFYQKFDIVLNALDNKEARNHVNRMCLIADVPLIESGTAGYNGQVELIKRSFTQCYECTPKAAQKSYPGCTIRNTPSEPIHCIVWAKHLFNQLFGEYNADEDVSPDTADPEAAAEAGKNSLNNDSNEKGNIDRVSTRMWAQNCKYDPEKLFNKLFHDDIKYLLSMTNLWKTRKPPQPCKWNAFDEPSTSELQNINVLKDQIVWSLIECSKVFENSVLALKENFAKLDKDDHLVWDKDEKDAMDFVASCANIRSYIFSIPKKSRFDIKSMAGNIIPAIATTNAITAGIVVMHALKVLQEKYEKCQSVYIRLRPNARNQIFVPDRNINPPNPKCVVCSKPKPEVLLKVNTKTTKIEDLKNYILINSLSVEEPEVTIDGKGIIVISSEEGETDCNDAKYLEQLGIVDGCVLKIDDFSQNFEFSIIVIHQDEPKFELIYDKSKVKPIMDIKKMEISANSTTSTASSNIEPSADNNDQEMEKVDDDDDDLTIVEEEEERMDVVPKENVLKRRKNEETGEPTAKRSKSNHEEDDYDDDEDDDEVMKVDDIITIN